MRSFCFSILLASIISLPLSAEKMRIAVIDLQPKGVGKMTSYAVTDMIRSDIVKTGLFTVVERSQMAEILKEQGLQMTGCTDSSCAVKVGRLLSAKKILLGEINQLRGTYIVTIRVVDVEKSASEYSARESVRGEENLDQVSVKLVKQLSESIVKGNKDFFVFKNPTGYYLRGALPGWGHFYAGNNLKGGLFLGGFSASAAFTVYAAIDYAKKRTAYLNVLYTAPQSEFDRKYNAKKTAGYILLSAASVTGIIYIYNWIDIVFFTRPDFSQLVYNAPPGDPEIYWSLSNEIDETMNPVYRFSINMRF